MQKAIVEIAKPCLVNLDSVVPDEKGQFCSVCQKSVVDFTQKSPEQITSYLKENRAQKPCGTFNRWDVRSDSKTDKLILYLQNKRLKFLTVLITGVLIITGCRLRTRGVVAYGYGENPRTLGGTTMIPPIQKDSLSVPEVK